MNDVQRLITEREQRAWSLFRQAFRSISRLEPEFERLARGWVFGNADAKAELIRRASESRHRSRRKAPSVKYRPPAMVEVWRQVRAGEIAMDDLVRLGEVAEAINSPMPGA